MLQTGGCGVNTFTKLMCLKRPLHRLAGPKVLFCATCPQLLDLKKKKKKKNNNHVNNTFTLAVAINAPSEWVFSSRDYTLVSICSTQNATLPENAFV